jgi:hypothetical protein
MSATIAFAAVAQGLVPLAAHLTLPSDCHGAKAQSSQERKDLPFYPAIPQPRAVGERHTQRTWQRRNTNEDQVDQRVRGRPGEGSALLYRRAGLTKKTDFSNGPFRWLTVASPDEPDGTELQLALNDNPAAKAYQQAIFQQGQPAVMF